MNYRLVKNTEFFFFVCYNVDISVNFRLPKMCFPNKTNNLFWLGKTNPSLFAGIGILKSAS